MHETPWEKYLDQKHGVVVILLPRGALLRGQNDFIRLVVIIGDGRLFRQVFLQRVDFRIQPMFSLIPPSVHSASTPFHLARLGIRSSLVEMGDIVTGRGAFFGQIHRRVALDANLSLLQFFLRRIGGDHPSAFGKTDYFVARVVIQV